jgi:two-component system chemotaxis response regulator CheY
MDKFLIIDDSKAVHAFITACTKTAKIELSHVFNGKEGLDFLQKDSSFDLILLDWEMPIMNGPDTFEQIKKLWPNIPVLMMTTKNEPSDIALMINNGVKEYMLKPFTSDILFEKIEYCIDRMVSRVA